MRVDRESVVSADVGGVTVELGVSGRELFDSLSEGRELSGAQRLLVLQAARLADKCDELLGQVDGRLTTVNSQGTETINPLISEFRMVSGQLSQILGKLGVGELPKVRSGKSLLDELAERRAQRDSA